MRIPEREEDKGGTGWYLWSKESRLDELVDRGTRVGHRTGSPNKDKVLRQQRIWGKRVGRAGKV